MKPFFKDFFKDVWNVPNALTMLRLLLVPVFVAVHQSGYVKLSLAVFVLASLTDAADGALARKYQLVTNFGKVMDPLADKLMVLSALICRALDGVIPWLFVFLVLGKELVMIVGGALLLKKQQVVYSRLLGKLAQVTFILALIASFFHKELLSLGFEADRMLLLAAIVLMFGALVDYAAQTLRHLWTKG